MDASTIYSHPGKPLQDHLLRTLHTGLTLFRDKKELNLPYSIEDTHTILSYILIFHDAGKMTPYFQRYLNKESGYELEKHDRLTEHGLISALIAAYQVYCCFSQHPHRQAYTILAFVAVRRHHGNLENFDKLLYLLKDDWSKIEKQLPHCYVEFFKQHFDSYIKVYDYSLHSLKLMNQEMEQQWKWDFLDKSTIENFFYFNFFYSILIYSDKQEAIFSQTLEIMQHQIEPDIVDKFKTKRFHNNPSGLNRLREDVYSDIVNSIDSYDTHNSIFSINVPTGSGKTLSALNAALRLREKFPQHKRIIYCLPFTSVIDQNAQVFETVLQTRFETIPTSMLLKHHHLAEISWTGKKDEEEYPHDEAQFLIETWSSELVVTTFWQFFHSVFSSRNTQLKKFHNIANSIIILDEIQAIPVKYWKFINQSLQTFARMFHCVILLVTATMPLIFSEKKQEIHELVPQKETYFRELNRVNLIVQREEKSIDTFATELISEIRSNPQKRYLIILNTIKSSQQLFLLLKKQGFSPLYLSTWIIPIHRLQAIIDIKERKRGNIVISTQLVEAGVDIDFDIVYRDIAPLDSVNQAAGRCNRENKMGNPGQVVLVNLKENGKSFSSYIYDTLLLRATQEVLPVEPVIPESRFFDISQHYYEKVLQVISSHHSSDLTENIRQLKYEDAFTGKDAFRLIQEDFERVSVFVEIDKDAEKVLEQYRNIKQIKDKWERKEAFDTIKGEFSQYIISISASILKKNCPPILEENSPFYFIPFHQLKEYYDIETGFKTESSTAIW